MRTTDIRKDLVTGLAQVNQRLTQVLQRLAQIDQRLSDIEQGLQGSEAAARAPASAPPRDARTSVSE